MEKVAREQGKILTPLNDDLVLSNCGLDSIGFAVLIARLDGTLGIDPFTASESALIPETFGEFVKAYENAAL